jgi:FtsP/CotA-like multicopper oxidase with cupredoxin domain
MKINPITYVILIVIVLVGLFYFLKPKTGEKRTQQTQSTPSTDQNQTPAPQDNTKSFDLVINSKKIAKGSETIKVTQGDDVVINITSDEPEELHLHGYDVSVQFEKDQAMQLKFNAKLSGRFPFELENSKIELGAVEVSPK